MDANLVGDSGATQHVDKVGTGILKEHQFPTW